MLRGLLAFVGLGAVGWGFLNYFHPFDVGSGDPEPCWLLGSALLGVAAILQVVAWFLERHTRQKGQELAAQSALGPGACTLCAANGPRIPVVLRVE